MTCAPITRCASYCVTLSSAGIILASVASAAYVFVRAIANNNKYNYCCEPTADPSCFANVTSMSVATSICDGLEKTSSIQLAAGFGFLVLAAGCITVPRLYKRIFRPIQLTGELQPLQTHEAL